MMYSGSDSIRLITRITNKMGACVGGSCCVPHGKTIVTDFLASLSPKKVSVVQNGQAFDLEAGTKAAPEPHLPCQAVEDFYLVP